MNNQKNSSVSWNTIPTKGERISVQNVIIGLNRKAEDLLEKLGYYQEGRSSVKGEPSLRE